MAIDFPASPTLNDVFTVGNVTYVWDGTKWTASVTGGISLDKIEEGNTSAEVIDTGSDGRFVVTTEGTERLFVNSNGNISVGSSLNDSVGSTTTLTVDQTSGNGQISLGANGTVRGRIFADNSTGELRIGNPTAGDLMLYTNNTERLRITSAGLVGIGTSSPGDQLTVYGNGANIRLQTAGTSLTNSIDYYEAANRRAFLKLDSSPGELQIGTVPAWATCFYTNNTERVRIDSSGRLGIGTSSPGDALTVQGTGNSYIGLQSATSGYASLKQIVTDTSAWLRTETSHPLYLGTNQTRAITIDTSQRVGIGTATVNRELVLYKASAPAFHIQNSTSGTGVFDGFAFSSIGADATIWNYENGYLRFGTNDTERARIDSSGRLLVGTSSARANFFNSNLSAAVQVEGTGSTDRRIAIVSSSTDVNGAQVVLAKQKSGSLGGNTIVAADDQLGSLSFQGSDGSQFVEAARIEGVVDNTPGANDMPGRLVFSTTADGASSPTERMRITQAGHVLIGCTSLPGGSTKGAGFYVTSTDTEYLSSINTTASKNHIIFYNPNGAVGTIATSGSATAYNTSSDYRLKENVVPLTGAADRLSKLQVHRFNFIADPDTTVDGFLAHEAQAVVPEAITGEKDEVDADGNPIYQGIDQSKLVPLLTAALQEAIAKIETLEGMVAVNNITIDEQQHQLSTLAARLTALENA
jgi:hypothetical protein